MNPQNILPFKFCVFRKANSFWDSCIAIRVSFSSTNQVHKFISQNNTAIVCMFHYSLLGVWFSSKTSTETLNFKIFTMQENPEDYIIFLVFKKDWNKFEKEWNNLTEYFIYGICNSKKLISQAVFILLQNRPNCFSPT